MMLLLFAIPQVTLKGQEGVKMPSFAYTMKFDLWDEFVDQRIFDSPLAKELVGGYPKLTTKHFITTKGDQPDPGRDVACGEVMSPELIAKAIKTSEDKASGQMSYYFRAASKDMKIFRVDSRNRVVGWSMFFDNDNEGTIFQYLFKRGLRHFGDPAIGQRKDGELIALWTWSKGPHLFMRYKSHEESKWVSSVEYEIE